VFGVSAVSRVQEALESAHATQGTLNAFTHLDDERALARAMEIDTTIERGEYAGPLAGMPIGLKDLIDHQGRTTTAGSAFYRKQATESALVVTRLESAGAIIIGRTGLHEFAFGFSSENPHFGPVRNPWDTGTSPGGSSGGSGAAVGAGITPVSIGTDTGGSVRVPAALCACLGLKVTQGRIPLEGVFPLVPSIDTVGPLADSIENLDIAYRVISGDETDEPRPRPLRLGVPQPWFDQAPMEERVAKSFDIMIDALGDMGHEVTNVELPHVMPSRELIYAIAEEVNEVHRDFRAKGLTYGDDVARRLDECASVTPEQMEAGRRWQGMIRDRFAEALGAVDLLITPTSPAMRKEIGNDSIGDRHYRAVISYFTAVVNHSFHPAIALPLNGSGSPAVGFQAIGSPGSETGLIGFGRSLEQEGLVGFTPAPLDLSSA
jgi:Asp-tRNA(Asn)/Glu-tRNA(Gln) amidotransferase A subunit family amidase